MASTPLSGQVLLKESQRGIDGVVVVASAPAPIGRLGSTVTDKDGYFSLDVVLPGKYDQADVTLTVIPPDGASAAKPLLVSAPRAIGGNPESFVLWIPNAAMAASAIERPASALKGTPDPHLIGARAVAEIGQRAELGEAIASSLAPAVTEHRNRHRATYESVEQQLRSDLAMDRRGRRVVRRVDTVADHVADAVGDGLANVAASGVSILRLTILPHELDLLRATPGSLQLDSKAVEAVTFAGGARARTRENAIERWCAMITRPWPSLDLPVPAPPVPDVPVENADLSAALTQIVDEIARRTAPVIAARGNDASVRSRLGSLELAVGPADRAAFFDYGMIVGTIDGVWVELLDSDLVANATDLVESLAEAGATPPQGGPLLQFLNRETRAVHLATGGNRISTRTVPTPIAVGRSLFGVIGGAVGGLFTHVAGALSGIFGSGGSDDRPQVRDHRNGQQDLATPGTNVVPPQMPAPRPPPDLPAPEYTALLAELNERLAEPYVFQVFAADGDDRAIDFGLFLTYRQTWVPQGNQAGALVKTTTLAPREERSYTTRTTYKKSSTAVRATNVENQRKTETQDTTRAATDIVNSAKSSMGFEATASGSTSVGAFSGSASTTFKKDSEHSSQETRQNMRESVRRSAQETKESVKVEVTTTESTETFREEAGKISNPNDEIPVTYLFYELQRRFRISERVHQVVPVIMVARPVPSPDHITRGWMFTNAWMLERALLDEQFMPALRYLIGDAAGVEAKMVEAKAARDEKRELTKSLQTSLASMSRDLEALYSMLRNGEVPSGVWDALLSATGHTDTEAVKKAYDLAAQREQAARERLAEAMTALEQSNQVYSEALAKFRDNELAVRRFLVHVKQNILHYMRVIWNMEDRDQRFFELQTVRVPRLFGHLEYKLVPEVGVPPVPPLWLPPYKIEATLVCDPVDPTATVPLGQIADIERPLGYKGNMMVFPLLEHNVLTKFLALPYLDNRMGACDPELLANFTLAELDQYVACAREALTAQDFADLLPRVRELYRALLERPFPDEEEIVVPTDSLFIEALPGTRPVLEDYKLLHRVIDVAKAAADVRARELENLRLVARIRGGLLSDPDIQTMVVAPENAGIDVVTPSEADRGSGAA